MCNLANYINIANGTLLIDMELLILTKLCEIKTVYDNIMPTPYTRYIPTHTSLSGVSLNMNIKREGEGEKGKVFPFRIGL